MHVLSTDPYNLKETYEYVIKNYGLEALNKITSILKVPKSRIIEIEALNIDSNNKMINLSAAKSIMSIEEIEKIIEVCQRNNIEITGSVFLSVSEEIEKIVEVCQRNNIEITGSVFLKPSEEIEKIVEVCQRNNIEITGSVFLKTAEEIEKIVEVCQENNVEITGSIFLKTAKDLSDSIEYIKNNYGESFLKPLIINKNVKYLMKVFPYLEKLHVLDAVIASASILTLKLEEIEERKAILDMQGIEMVNEKGKFNSIFGLSRKKYNELKRKIIGEKAFNK